MSLYFSEKINKLAKALDKPLYAVGGYVRNYLIDGSLSSDIDLCAPIKPQEIEPLLESCGFEILCEYKRTGTVVFRDEVGRYEFTCFRKETYLDGGAHKPSKTEFTDDILVDAKRRDFKCNAVYYDIKNKRIVDVLGGVEDIRNKILDTVCDAKEVFSHDGLRLLRLARFSGELSFTPSNCALQGAREYAKNVLDISVERIYDELKKILACDSKYSFSNKRGHYEGLRILDETRVLDYIIPELTLGRNMEQRKDFHKYDVLEHSLKTVLYADKSVRLTALLHDVGKPYSMNKYGNFYTHAIDGEPLVRNILNRLKVDKKTINEVCFLTKTHMLDLRCDMGERKVRYFIAQNYKMLDKILLLKQADFSGSRDDLSVAPTVKRWKEIVEKMEGENIPFSVKQLDIKPKEILQFGFKESDISRVLEELLKKVIYGEIPNSRESLIKGLSSLRVY